MAYDEDLAHRIRAVVSSNAGLSEKKMFGGLAFLINGNMAVSASGQGGLLLRCDPAKTEALIAAPEAARHSRCAAGRWTAGLRVQVDDLDDEVLQAWVSHGVDYASSLPSK